MGGADPGMPEGDSFTTKITARRDHKDKKHISPYGSISESKKKLKTFLLEDRLSRQTEEDIMLNRLAIRIYSALNSGSAAFTGHT